MLIRKKQTKTLSLSVAMSMDDHKRLEHIKAEAERQGFDIDLRGAIHDALLKLMRRAERELNPKSKVVAGSGRGSEMRSQEI